MPRLPIGIRHQGLAQSPMGVAYLGRGSQASDCRPRERMPESQPVGQRDDTRVLGGVQLTQRGVVGSTTQHVEVTIGGSIGNRSRAAARNPSRDPWTRRATKKKTSALARSTRCRSSTISNTGR